MAELHFNEAIKHVRRGARAAPVDALRDDAEGAGPGRADCTRRTRRPPINLLTQYGSANAIAWQQDWLTLGDLLLGKYAMGMVDGQTAGYPHGGTTSSATSR